MAGMIMEMTMMTMMTMMMMMENGWDDKSSDFVSENPFLQLNCLANDREIANCALPLIDCQLN